MKNAVKHTGSLLGVLSIIVILVLIIATFPSLLSMGREENVPYYTNFDDPEYMGDELYMFQIHPDNLWRKPLLYLRQIHTGEVFSYKQGKTSRNYLAQAPRPFLISLSYLIMASSASLLGGLYFSLKGAEKRRTPLGYELLSLMTVIPDFILVLLLQILFYNLNRITGAETIRVSSLSNSHRAVLLPLLVMLCYPTLYIVRTLGTEMKRQYNATYILFARARGVSPSRIRYFHLGPAAVHFVKGDLHKILAVLFMNLFVTELLFNINGLTGFLFSNIKQYSFMVNTIFLSIGLYLISYALLRLLLLICQFLLRRDYR